MIIAKMPIVSNISKISVFSMFKSNTYCIDTFVMNFKYSTNINEEQLNNISKRHTISAVSLTIFSDDFSVGYSSVWA